MDTSKGEVTMMEKPRRAGDNRATAAQEGVRRFTFDAVYDWTSKQRELYEHTFQPIVDAVLQGYNGTVFAYGQTGSGKTYTMTGERGDPEKQGLIPNSFDHIFSHISHTQDEQYLVRVSYLEIYKEEVRDLLSKDHKRRLKLRERPDTGVYVEDLSSFVAKSVREVEHVMTVGGENRKVGPTNMNKHSSRSHAIFILTVECCAKGLDGEDHIHVGKLNLVDLAGSERQSKTGATGERFVESTKINLSLSALGNVISALVDDHQTHIPYRDSKLTRLLQDSLGGNAKTVMVANIGPADYNYDETLITLRYANRAKNIQNRPRINEDPKDALLREFQDEILRLKSALEKRKRKSGPRGVQHRTDREGVSGEESEESVDEDKMEVESLAVQQQHLEAEKEALLHNTEIVLEEREQLVAELQLKVDRLKKEQKKRDALAAKIKAMESKLLVGGKSIIDHTHEQQKKLDQHKQEIAQQELREREMVQQLEARKEDYIEIKGTFTSLKDEVENKTKKLNKLLSKLREVQDEIEEREEEHRRDREQLAIAAHHLQKELSLRQLIVDNFIPVEDVEKIKSRATLNDETDEWTLSPIQASNTRSELHVMRPVSRLGSVRPISSSARLAAATGNPRYMAENILHVELDMPPRTTKDYECPSVAPSIKAALTRVMAQEEEITIDASPFTPSQKTHSVKYKTRLRHSSEPVARPTSQFPHSRGLVTPSV